MHHEGRIPRPGSEVQRWNGLTVQRLTRTIGLNVKLGVIPASANLTWKAVVDTRMWKQANAALTHKKKQT